MRTNTKPGVVKSLLLISTLALLILACVKNSSENQSIESVLKPLVVTDPVQNDTDDPAIWIHPENPAKSLIIGTDKDENGGLYVFDLNGKTVSPFIPLRRPNNVDIEYGLIINGKPVDIVVATERFENRIRIFSLPDMQPIDNGGIPVFT